MTSPVDAVGPQATLPADYDYSKTTADAKANSAMSTALDPEAFLQLLVAQLKYQDPTNPVDTSQFMNQTAMLSQVQTMNSMNTMLTDMFTAQQTQAATGMIGKQVSFLDPDGNPVSGVVSSIQVQHGTSMLIVGDLAVPLAGVLEVAAPGTDLTPVPDAGDGSDTESGDEVTDPGDAADNTDTDQSAGGTDATDSGTNGSTTPDTDVTPTAPPQDTDPEQSGDPTSNPGQDV